MTAWVNERPDQPVIYAGANELRDLPIPIIRDSLPRAIASLTPTRWIVADPWSFPFEHLTEPQLDAPIDVILPARAPYEGYYRTVDQALLRELGPFDTVACSADLWERLAPARGWSSSQWVHRPARLEEATRQLIRRARTATRVAEELDPTLASDWNVGVRKNKARFRSESAELVPLIRAAARRISPGTEPRVIELGRDIGRYVGLLRAEGHDPTSLRLADASSTHLRFDHPGLDVVSLGSRAATTLPPESVDLALLSVDYMDLPLDVRRRILNRILGSLRVGGTLIEVRRLDIGSRATLSEALATLVEYGGNQLTRETLVSLRNRETGRSDTSIMSFTKIGVPREW